MPFFGINELYIIRLYDIIYFIHYFYYKNSKFIYQNEDHADLTCWCCIANDDRLLFLKLKKKGIDL
jgi:hypothetical protein